MNNVLDVLYTGHKGEDTELNIPEDFVLTKQEALELRDFNGKFCITSLYLLEEINKLRIREGKTIMEHKTLLRTIEREFEKGEIAERLTVVSYSDVNNKKQKMYLLNEQFYNHILYLEKHKGHRKKSNLLYVITDGELNKIGITHNNINQRLKALQTGNGRQLKVIYTLKTDKAEELEYELHNKFNKYRKVGEWFSIDVITILEEIERLK